MTANALLKRLIGAEGEVSIAIYSLARNLLVHGALLVALLLLLDPLGHFFDEMVVRLKVAEIFKLKLPPHWVLSIFAYVKFVIYILYALRLADILSSAVVITSRRQSGIAVSQVRYFFIKHSWFLSTAERNYHLRQNVLERFLDEATVVWPGEDGVAAVVVPLSKVSRLGLS